MESIYQLSLEVIAGKHPPLNFRDYYEEMAGTKLVPDMMLYNKKYWTDLDEKEEKAVDVLIRHKRTDVLAWVVGRQSEWRVSKESENKIVNYFTEQKKHLFGSSLMLRDRVANARIKGEAQKMEIKPLKLKENKMDNLREYLEEQDEIEFEKELNENVFVSHLNFYQKH